MKKLFHLLLVIVFVCFGASIYGMKRKNSTTLIIRNPNYTIQEYPHLPLEVMVHIAGFCWPKEKNALMRTCKDLCVCLKDRTLILLKNLSTISLLDKIEALIEYAHEGNVKMVGYLLENGINVNYSNMLGLKSFHDAHKDVMPLLIKYGAQIHEFKPSIHRLHEATYKNEKEIVRILLGSGVNPNLALVNSITPLFIASQKGYSEIGKLLLAADGIQVNQGNANDATALMFASWNGHGQIVKLLLAAGGIDVNQRDAIMLTALMYATSNEQIEVVALLLQAGADVNCADDEGLTGLMYATIVGNTEIVALLLQAGARVNHANVRGETALMIASKKGYVEIVKLLLAANGIQVNEVDNFGSMTSLSFASEAGYVEIVKLLLAADDIDVNCVDNDGTTPLLLALNYEHTEIVKLLLAVNGIDVSQVEANYLHAYVPYIQQLN